MLDSLRRVGLRLRVQRLRARLRRGRGRPDPSNGIKVLRIAGDTTQVFTRKLQRIRATKTSLLPSRPQRGAHLCPSSRGKISPQFRKPGGMETKLWCRRKGKLSSHGTCKQQLWSIDWKSDSLKFHSKIRNLLFFNTAVKLSYQNLIYRVWRQKKTSKF